MKNFISKNLGYIILSMMLVGMFTLGLGLDWDQSQIPWRGRVSGWVIGTGATLLGGGLLLLKLNTRSK
jgi:hypothetical protein